MSSYYDSKYGTTYTPGGSSSYYDSKYGTTYTPGGGSSYYDSKYGSTYTPGGGSSYYDSKYGSTYTPGGGSSYYDSKYGSSYNPYSGYNSGSSDSGDSSSYYSGGCYISTACLKAKNFSDDCFELNILRKYRDKLVAEDENIRKVVKEYYEKAPKVVEKLELCENKNEIYEYIYQELVVGSIAYLISGEYEKAVGQYKKVYDGLKEKYGI